MEMRTLQKWFSIQKQVLYCTFAIWAFIVVNPIKFQDKLTF